MADDAHPNTKFFEKYGSFDDPESITSRSQFLLIRHATSAYNVKDRAFRKELFEKYPDTDPESKLKRNQALADLFTQLDDEMTDALIVEPDGAKQATDQ